MGLFPDPDHLPLPLFCLKIRFVTDCWKQSTKQKGERSLKDKISGDHWFCCTDIVNKRFPEAKSHVFFSMSRTVTSTKRFVMCQKNGLRTGVIWELSWLCEASEGKHTQSPRHINNVEKMNTFSIYDWIQPPPFFILIILSIYAFLYLLLLYSSFFFLLRRSFVSFFRISSHLFCRNRKVNK